MQKIDWEKTEAEVRERVAEMAAESSKNDVDDVITRIYASPRGTEFLVRVHLLAIEISESVENAGDFAAATATAMTAVMWASLHKVVDKPIQNDCLHEVIDLAHNKMHELLDLPLDETKHIEVSKREVGDA